MIFHSRLLLLNNMLLKSIAIMNLDAFFYDILKKTITPYTPPTAGGYLACFLLVAYKWSNYKKNSVSFNPIQFIEYRFMNSMFALSHIYHMVYASRYHQAILHIVRNNFWNPVTILVGFLCPCHCKYLVWWVFIFNNSGCWALSMVVTQWCLIWVCRKTNETVFLLVY